MKKLTAGIFATILCLTTVNAFAATAGTKVASTTYVDGAVAAANAYTDTKVGGVNTALDGYMKVDAFNSFKTENTAAINKAASDAQTAAATDATTKADAAKEAAISAAAADATSKANTAETNAKAYTDQQVGTLPAGSANVVAYVDKKTEGIASDTELQTLKTTVGDHTTSINNINTALAGKQATITGAQLEALNSGIDATKVSAYDGYAATIEGAVSDASTAKNNAAKAVLDAAAAVKDAGDALTEAGAASAAAGEAKTNAASALTTANNAFSKAEKAETTAGTALTAANKATDDVTALTTTVNGKLDTTTAEATYATKTSVSDLAGDVNENATAISNLQTASATHATKSEVEAVDNKLANYVLLSDVVDTYPAAN